MKSKTHEYYFQLIYRPIGVNGLDSHEEEATLALNKKLVNKIKQLEALTVPKLKLAKSKIINIKYRIVNVTNSLDPRVSTDPGLNSIITIMHVAYWFED